MSNTRSRSVGSSWTSTAVKPCSSGGSALVISSSQNLTRTHVRVGCCRTTASKALGGNVSTDEVRRRAHSARLYPSTFQATTLERQGHTARALWNLLDEWYTCRSGGIAKRPSTAEIDRQLRAARSDPLPGWEWLADLPAQASQQVLKHYLRTWDWFYAGWTNPPRRRSWPSLALIATGAWIVESFTRWRCRMANNSICRRC
jgi:putative transposase